jgi:hypothetical protein
MKKYERRKRLYNELEEINPSSIILSKKKREYLPQYIDPSFIGRVVYPTKLYNEIQLGRNHSNYCITLEDVEFLKKCYIECKEILNF